LISLKASFALGTFVTVFQAEVYAILACSEYCLKECMTTKLGVLIGLLTGHVPLNKHLHMMGLFSDPTCAAYGIEEESALHFICVYPTLTNLRAQILGKPILSVSEYEGMSAGSFVQFAELME
jgi:hypothetical protein